MTYEEYRKKTQKEFNELPVFFCFGNEQFKKAMEERGLTEKDTDKIYSLGCGCYYLRKDADVVRKFINRKDDLPELMKDFDFAVSAFIYEMQNHEYQINYQGDWDVCSCFGNCEFAEHKTYRDYLRQEGYGDDVIKAYSEAKKKYFKLCDENDWW